MSIKAKTPTETPKPMSRLVDEALARATLQATEGPRELRDGRYRPEAAAAFRAKPGE